MRVSIVLGLAAVLATAASAQPTLTMGSSNFGAPYGSDKDLGAVRTAVDLAAPANASGELDRVRFHWSATGCAAAAKVKVFRRVGDTLTLVAERGPFDITSDPMDFALEPAIPVIQGDLIGLARVADCGNPQPEAHPFGETYIEVPGDVASFSYSSAAVNAGRLAVRAAGTATEVVAGVITSVASNAGRNGANYRTLVQMLSPPFASHSAPLNGRFVFHPKGIPGGLADVSMPFSIIEPGVQSWADILTAMGVGGQPGSIDVVVPWGRSMPPIAAHIYNDQGAHGTTGCREEPVVTTNHGSSLGSTIFFPGAIGFLFGPADAVRFRCNFAVRSLEAGVDGSLQAFRSNGAPAGAPVPFHYGPNTWDQGSWEQFTGVALEDGDYVQITVGQGSAIFDGSIIDQVTNDPADLLARVFSTMVY